MGPEFNRFHHHQVHQRNAIFLPMLCSRLAIKDVHGLPRCVDRSSSSSSDPLSPRISCIGQVKRKNRVVGFPNPHRSLNTLIKNTTNNNNTKTDNHNIHIVKYSKLKKFFSSKNLTPNTNTPVAGNGRRRVPAPANGANGNGCCGCSSRGVCNSEKCVVSVVDLDPPLPVVKRPIQAQEGMELESLWKRRSGGVALKGLQLQQIHHPRHHHYDHLDQPTTV